MVHNTSITVFFTKYNKVQRKTENPLGYSEPLIMTLEQLLNLCQNSLYMCNLHLKQSFHDLLNLCFYLNLGIYGPWKEHCLNCVPLICIFTLHIH